LCGVDWPMRANRLRKVMRIHLRVTEGL